MKVFFKVLAVFILSAMLLASFAACRDTGDTTDAGTTPAETTPPEISASLKLVENGQSAFKVVIPKGSTYADRTRLEKFVSSFKNKTGVELQLVNDSDELYENEDYEVLIGEVNRKESQEVLSQLRSNEYFYGFVGNKLVITAKNDVTLDDAIQFFLRKVIDIKVAADKANITLEESDNYFYRYNYAIQEFFIGENAAGSYSIVYSDSDSNGSYLFAVKLSGLIFNLTGFELPVIKDSKKATDYEIVIGKTNRGVEIDNRANSEFSIVCKGNKLYMSCEYAVGYDYLYTYVQRLFANADKTLSFENGYSYKEDFSASLVNGTENILSKSGSIRVIFHNVLLHNYEEAPTTWRAKYSLDVYRDYAPDVIGLQEMQNLTGTGGYIRTAIASGLEDLGYVEVPYTERNSTFSFMEDPVFYNPKTLTLITSGAYRFDEKLDRNKSIGWALFEEKATGKRFIVASTHYAWLEDYETAAALRTQHAYKTISKLQELTDRYNVPIILGGDFNSSMWQDPIVILRTNGLLDVESLAQKTEDQATNHSSPVFDLETKMCKSYFMPVGGNDAQKAIDHIFSYNGTNVTFNTYDVITDPFALATSDHCPLLADFTLN